MDRWKRALFLAFRSWRFKQVARLLQRGRGFVRQRLRFAMHRIKPRGRTIDVQVENIGPVVMAREVVPQLHLNADLEVAIGIEDALLSAHRSRNDAAVGRNDAGTTG